MKKLIVFTLLVFSFTQLLANCQSIIFGTLDGNLDGGLDEIEYGQVDSEFSLSQPFSWLDTDQSGSISSEEFASFNCFGYDPDSGPDPNPDPDPNPNPGSGSDPNPNPDFVSCMGFDCFEFLDEDASGYLTLQEYEMLTYISQGEDLDFEVVDFSLLDLDWNSLLSPYEFEQIIYLGGE